MSVKTKTGREEEVTTFSRLLKSFGESVAEIWDDPEVRRKAREFSESLVDSAAKIASSKIKDEDVRKKFTDVGKAAQTLGKSVLDEFEKEKSKAQAGKVEA
jgi:[ribosomal protein S5]-alanine N-acetyltransferase